MGLTDASDSRLVALTRWVVETLGFADSTIAPASADASFRRYFRLVRGDDSYIVMDAPPDKEDLTSFVDVARRLAGMGLNVPIVLAREQREGFLLLSDLGTCLYLDELKAARQVDRLYGDALSALVKLQTTDPVASRALPAYDRVLLRREMELMPEWFLGRHLGLTVTTAERDLLDRLFESLCDTAGEQPKTFVHRDYHSRNLLYCGSHEPGILDFQDAVHGPLTYDAASLLKDCYIAWPRARVLGWLADYRRALLATGFDSNIDEAQFVRWFDLIALQRHLKVLGIFARLFYRDGKAGYLNDLPLVLEYVRAAAAMYPETAPFAHFLTGRVDPVFTAAQHRAGDAARRRSA